jgi:hypothetical protein
MFLEAAGTPKHLLFSLSSLETHGTRDFPGVVLAANHGWGVVSSHGCQETTKIISGSIYKACAAARGMSFSYFCIRDIHSTISCRRL